MKEFEIKEKLLVRCPKCERFLIGGRYYDIPLGEAISRSIIKNSSIPKDYSVTVEQVRPIIKGNKLPKRITAQVIIRGDGEELETEIGMAAKNEQCQECAKMSSNYFEATLQLKTRDERIINRTETILKENRVGIKSKKKSKNGYDFMLTSNHGMIKSINRLSEEYPPIITISKKLHTKDNLTGKELFRVTALYIPIEFKRNDTVEYEDERWIYLGFNRNRFKLRSLTLHPKDRVIRSEKYDELKKIEPFSTQVVAVRPQIRILDENYQQADAISTSLESFNAGDNVTAIENNGRYFIISKN